jgi:hypothetical protein
MPRRRRRTTNRQPQDRRQLRIRGLRLDNPDVSKLSRAFIGLALARAAAEAQAEADARSNRSAANHDPVSGADSDAGR